MFAQRMVKWRISDLWSSSYWADEPPPPADPLAALRSARPVSHSILWLPERFEEAPARAPFELFVAQRVFKQVLEHASAPGADRCYGLLVGQLLHDRAMEPYVRIDETRPSLEPLPEGDDYTSFRDFWWEVNEEARSHELEVVGWYHAHLLLGLFLTDRDLALHAAHFKQPWHCALLLAPDGRSPAGAFFQRTRGDSLFQRSSLPFYEVLPHGVRSKGGPHVSAVAWRNYRPAVRIMRPPHWRDGAEPPAISEPTAQDASSVAAEVDAVAPETRVTADSAASTNGDVAAGEPVEAGAEVPASAGSNGESPIDTDEPGETATAEEASTDKETDEVVSVSAERAIEDEVADVPSESGAEETEVEAAPAAAEPDPSAVAQAEEAGAEIEETAAEAATDAEVEEPAIEAAEAEKEAVEAAETGAEPEEATAEAAQAEAEIAKPDAEAEEAETETAEVEETIVEAETAEALALEADAESVERDEPPEEVVLSGVDPSGVEAADGTEEETAAPSVSEQAAAPTPGEAQVQAEMPAAADPASAVAEAETTRQDEPSFKSLETPAPEEAAVVEQAPTRGLAARSDRTGTVAVPPGGAVEDEGPVIPPLVMPDPMDTRALIRNPAVRIVAIGILGLIGVSLWVATRETDDGSAAWIAEAVPTTGVAPPPAPGAAATVESTVGPSQPRSEIEALTDELASRIAAYAERQGDFDAGRIDCAGLASGYARVDETFVALSALIGRGTASSLAEDDRYIELAAATDSVNTHFDDAGCARPD